MKHRSERTTNTQIVPLIAGALSLLILFVSAAYFFFLYQPGMSPEQAAALTELYERRAEWQAERPPAFQYEVIRAADSNQPFTVIEDLDDDSTRPWLDEFFADLEAAMVAGERVSVSYDARFGYPSDFTIANAQTIVRDFEVIRYAEQSP